MSMSLRHPEILDLIRTSGHVEVEELATRFGVSVQTIRRDLSDLAAMGRIERVHGGAILASGTANIAYGERRSLNSDAKSVIAEYCAQMIPNECSIFLNIGTTTEAVARRLQNHKGLLVVTNNMNIATVLGDAPEIDMIVTGGALRPSDGGLVGPFTNQTIRQFKFDYAIVGCSALGEEGELFDFDDQEVEASRIILQSARTSILVADSSKFLRTAPIKLADVAAIDHFVTDIGPDKRVRQVLKTSKTTLHIAGEK